MAEARAARQAAIDPVVDKARYDAIALHYITVVQVAWYANQCVTCSYAFVHRKDLKHHTGKHRCEAGDGQCVYYNGADEHGALVRCRNSRCAGVRGNKSPSCKAHGDVSEQLGVYHCRICDELYEQLKQLLTDARDRSQSKEHRAKEGVFDLTIEYLRQLLKDQLFCCKISGVSFYAAVGIWWQVSLDRIEDHVTYCQSNVRLVCLEFNTPAKWRADVAAELFESMKGKCLRQYGTLDNMVELVKKQNMSDTSLFSKDLVRTRGLRIRLLADDEEADD